METMYEKLVRCAETVKAKSDGFKPEIAIILGSGLGNLGNVMDVKYTVPYSEIEGFPVSTVLGHKGQFLLGYLEGVPVVCMQGRVHYYEGFDMQDVLLPTRVMGLLGAKKLFLTNASGSLNRDIECPAMLLVKDHIMLFFPNPLIGPNIDQLGTRFPDMSHVYDPEMCEVLRQTAKDLNLKLYEGNYVQLTGPTYETPAEVRLLGSLGGDCVGMSTACEAAAANHMGIRVCCVSCVANPGAGIADHPLTHAEVAEAGIRMENDMTTLVRAAIPRLAAL